VSTQVDAVILALVAKWQALSVTGGTLEGVRVVDGPQATEDGSQDWLYVGHDGADPGDSGEAATAEQSLLAFLRTRQEDAGVQCAAVSVRGNPDIPAARQRALAITSAAENALRLDMPLSGLVMHSFISNIAYTPLQTGKGAKVRVVFTVTYQAQV
jgi:hypothetical protein